MDTSYPYLEALFLSLIIIFAFNEEDKDIIATVFSNRPRVMQGVI
jgi:hypothetical protein